MTPATKVIVSVTLGSFALIQSGCRSCHDDHPYVPYTIAASRAAADAALDASEMLKISAVPTLDAGTDPFAGRPSVEVPVGITSFALEGVTLQAPPGLVLQRALLGNLDADVEKTAFAIARSADGAEAAEVVFYRGQGPDGSLAIATILPGPSLQSLDAGCSSESRLVGVGKRSVLAELGEVCAPTGSFGPSRPARYVAVIDSGVAARVRFAVTIADPEGSASLSLDAVVADRDGDGRDDLALRVTLDGGGATLEPGPAVSAVSAWLDRPAGLSRDTEATEASFRSLAESAASRAARAKDSHEVPGYVAHVFGLWRALCAESGAPRLVVALGAGIACDVPHELEALGLAEVRALASMGKPMSAALALGRTERPPASRTPSRVADALKWISQKAPVSSARLVRKAAAVPASEVGREPSWGPLTFEPSGKLLIRTGVGVVRLDPDLGDEASAGSREWKPSVTSPDGSMTWIAAYDNCDGLSLRAAFEVKPGGDRRETPIPVDPPLGDRCGGGRVALARALPIAWGPSGLEAIVDGQPILIASDLTHASLLEGFVDQPPTPGGPRSPDGNVYVVPTEVGFVVQGEARVRLLRASELDGTYGDQEHCVVSSDATHVACVHAGAAWVGTWDAPGD